MADSSQFVAQLLESGARGYAGIAAGVLLEDSPRLSSPRSEESFELWKGHLEQRLGELAAALSFGSPDLFASGVLWSHVGFQARGLPVEDLALSLDVLEGVLVEKMPEQSASVIAPYVEAARSALRSPSAEHDGLSQDGGTQLVALRYVEALLEGEAQRALDHLQTALDGGLTLADVFEQVLVPAQREIGRMWHVGEINVAEEHFATAATQRAAAVLSQQAERAASNGKTVLSACVAGNTHDLGIRLINELFEVDGWRAILLAQNVPQPALVESLERFDAELVLLSVALASQLRTARSAIELIREHREQTKVLVGGAVFRRSPELWRQLGADGWADSIRGAIAEGRRLVVLD